MRKIRVAQIGTSRYSHGNDIFSTLVKHPEVFDIAGFALPEGEKELVIYSNGSYRYTNNKGNSDFFLTKESAKSDAEKFLEAQKKNEEDKEENKAE